MGSWRGPAQCWTEKEAPKHFPRAKIAPKRCLVVCCPSDPLQLSESQRNCYIWSMLIKSTQCTKNCNACSHHSSTGPNSPHDMPDRIEQPAPSKAEQVGYKVLPHTHIHLTSRQPTATFLSISLTFCRENAFITSRRHKMLSKSSTTEAWIVMLQNKQMYLSLAKMCWLWWFIFWLIKVCLSLFIII